MNLVIDIGNSRIKLAVFEKSKMLFEDVLDTYQAAVNHSLFATYPSIKSCIISTVREDNETLSPELEKRGIQIMYMDAKISLPFSSQYKTPETLGRDRIAGIAGAFFLYPERDLLVIDAGTALTIDLFTQINGYMGGNISPGLSLRFKALNAFTGKLPFLTADDSNELIGNSTENAIRSGVQNGLLFELEAYLTKFRNRYPQIAVILTGGDAQFFDNKLKKSIFVVQNLTLVGLNFILDYNAQTS